MNYDVVVTRTTGDKVRTDTWAPAAKSGCYMWTTTGIANGAVVQCVEEDHFKTTFMRLATDDGLADKVELNAHAQVMYEALTLAVKQTHAEDVRASILRSEYIECIKALPCAQAKKGTITLAISGNARTVEATIYSDVFAVDKRKEVFDGVQQNGFVVTHVKSGLKIPRCFTAKSSAVLFIKACLHYSHAAFAVEKPAAPAIRMAKEILHCLENGDAAPSYYADAEEELG